MFSLYTAGAGTVNILSVSGITGSVLLFNMLSSVILNDPSFSSNSSIASVLCPAVLAALYLFTTPLLQGEPGDVLPNVMTLGLAQVALRQRLEKRLRDWIQVVKCKDTGEYLHNIY